MTSSKIPSDLSYYKHSLEQLLAAEMTGIFLKQGKVIFIKFPITQVLVHCFSATVLSILRRHNSQNCIIS